MAPLEEPSVGELIRTLSLKMDGVASQLAALQTQMTNFVTQEQRAADQALEAERRAALVQRISELETDRTATRRLVWSSILGPVIVGVVLWLLVGGGIK